MSAQVLVVTGDGINCEQESARAFQDVGATTEIVHINALLKDPRRLSQAKIFFVPGGFSFGDELKSGKILAEKMRVSLLPVLAEFTDRGGLTIGVCNGFQVLIQLGVFEAFWNTLERTVTLGTNDHGQFLNRWVTCDVAPDAARSPWFKNISGPVMLPMRHKEGRIEYKSGDPKWVPLIYQEDVNGSSGRAAALLDQTGQIFGIMPHPEAATQGFLNPLPAPSEVKEANAKQMKQLFTNALNWSSRK